MKPRHVCFLLPPIEYYSPQSGGAFATVAMNQAREFLARGYHVTVLAPQDKNPTYNVGNVVPLTVATRADLNILQRAFSSRVLRPLRHYDWLYYEYYVRSVQKAIHALKQQNDAPNVVLVFNDFHSPRLLRKLLPDARILLRLGNMVKTNAPNPSEVLRMVDGVIAISNFIRDWTLQNFEVDPTRVVTAINGVDSDMFQPAEDFLETPFLRGQGPLQVLFVGRTDYSKGPDIVANATRVLQEEGRDVQLAVAGATWFYDQGRPPDPYLAQLQEQLNTIGAKYLGYVARPDLPAVFQSADVVGMPTRLPEPLGNVALEAMASGCALIAARRGGLPEICEGAALIIDPAKPEEFTDALRKLYENHDLLRDYKKKGRARALEYSWSRNVDILERMLFL